MINKLFKYKKWPKMAQNKKLQTNYNFIFRLFFHSNVLLNILFDIFHLT